MEFNEDYLKRLASIETPKWEMGILNDEREQQCYEYCELRNAAKSLLKNPKDREAEGKLSELIKKLKM